MNIIIYCGHTNFEWSPKSEKEGIGGSEEATINITRELARLGNDVTVYNRCGDNEGTYDGVKYENYEYFDDIDCDVLVIWRQPSYVYNLKDKHRAKQTFLWLHDTVPENEILPVKHFLTGIFVLSGFHATLYPNLRDKLIKTSNGINLSQFDQKVKRNPYKIVYGSSYDRGLKELLEMWPEIKSYEKEAELDVFYGWGGIDAQIEAGNDNFKHFKDEMSYLLKQEGIHELGRISHAEVAKEFLSAGVWCYPCWFPEISCITAMKAQAGGAIPVITPTAALQETTKWGLTTIQPRDYKGEMPWGTDMDAKQMDTFVEITKQALNPEYQERIRPQMMAEAKNYSWDRVAKGWDALWKSGKQLKK